MSIFILIFIGSHPWSNPKILGFDILFIHFKTYRNGFKKSKIKGEGILFLPLLLG